jgi:hypothetical protein
MRGTSTSLLETCSVTRKITCIYERVLVRRRRLCARSLGTRFRVLQVRRQNMRYIESLEHSPEENPVTSCGRAVQ